MGGVVGGAKLTFCLWKAEQTFSVAKFSKYLSFINNNTVLLFVLNLCIIIFSFLGECLLKKKRHERRISGEHSVLLG
jgi:hypothetical protein